MQSVIQIILSNLYLIGVLSLMTLGVTLTYKTAKIVNFAQAITSTVGIFIAAYLASRLGGESLALTIDRNRLVFRHRLAF